MDRLNKLNKLINNREWDFISYLKFKANVVYGDGVLPGKILRHSSEE